MGKKNLYFSAASCSVHPLRNKCVVIDVVFSNDGGGGFLPPQHMTLGEDSDFEHDHTLHSLGEPLRKKSLSSVSLG